MTSDVIDGAVAFERERDTQAWARWLARSIDGLLMTPFVLAIFLALGAAVELGRLPPEFIGWADNQLATAVVEIVTAFVLAALWEPLFLSNTGTTPGKWIMGVRLRRADGRHLSLLTAYGRFFWVYAVGLGFGIPLVALICMVISRAKLVSEGATAWDKGLKVDVVHTKRHPLVWTLMVIFVVGLNILIGVLSRMPA